MRERALVVALARACISGSQEPTAVAIRLADTLGVVRKTWIVDMAARYVRTFEGKAAPRERDVVRFVVSDRSWLDRIRAKKAKSKKRRVHQWLYDAPLMRPAPAANEWNVPILTSLGELANWLEISSVELEWLADQKGLLRHVSRSPLHHYHYRVVQKRSGGIRLIEAPQPRLMVLQRKILTEILERVPQYYSAAHGFVRGRSVQTFASPHVGKAVVLRLDLRDFFPTIGIARVQAIFRTMGYPEKVADALGALCTNAAPHRLFASSDATLAPELQHLIAARSLYTRQHLPQGAPTSPLLANMCAYRLDCRLTGLADWVGGVYTRYADDLAFSGDEQVSRHASKIATQAAAIALREGWSVQFHKTRIMRRGVRQHLAGIVVNDHPNISRDKYDALKATLTNCVRLGAAMQNRDGHPDFEAHLRGRVGWVTSVNPARGRRLQELFDRITWD